jgi:hypothetical protein
MWENYSDDRKCACTAQAMGQAMLLVFRCYVGDVARYEEGKDRSYQEFCRKIDGVVYTDGMHGYDWSLAAVHNLGKHWSGCVAINRDDSDDAEEADNAEDAGDSLERQTAYYVLAIRLAQLQVAGL